MTFALIMMFASHVSAVGDDGVYILETRSNENSSAFFDAFMTACPSCEGASILDAAGDGKILKRHAKVIASKSPKLVVASGFPAIEAIASRKKSKTPLIASLTTRQKMPVDEEMVFGLSTDFSIDWAFHVAEALFGSNPSVGIVSSLELSELQIEKFNKINSQHLNAQVLLVSNPSELPEIIDQAYRDHSIVIFGKDALVVNRQSIDFIRAASIRHNKPTIVHSSSLVGKGFPLAITPNLTAHGVKAGQFANRFIKTGAAEFYLDVSDFELLVDCSVLARNKKTVKMVFNPCEEQELNVADLGILRVSIP